jgi:ubiquinone/menaquinone biosynthesis C-methylase UbiE
MSHQRDATSVFNSGFSNIDATEHPAALVSHQDRVNTQAAIQAYKQQAYALLGLQPGDHVLDVGCGSGDDVRALAQIVGSTGRAIGVDVSETMVAQARVRSEGLELPLSPGQFAIRGCHEHANPRQSGGRGGADSDRS